MWTTPAPPSTAFVAASIWSGTGEVKTAPGHAASSMPVPTKPPCSGSWPEPPPETSAALPLTGSSLRGGDGRLPCAVRFGDGSPDRAGDLPRRRHPVVGEDGDGRADQVGGDVREQLLHPVVHPAVDGGDEQRADRARRIQRRVRHRPDGDDDPDDDESDHEAGPALRRPRIDDAHDGEEEDGGADALDQHRRGPRGRRAVEVHDAEAVPKVDSARPEAAPHGERSGDATGEL